MIWHYPHYGNQGGEPASVIRISDWKLVYYYEDERAELYNLREDVSETNDLSMQNKERVIELKKKLFEHLESVGASYPKIDSLYDAEKERQYLERISTKFMTNLERQRGIMYSDDYKPNKNWWGSALTID